MSARYPCEGRWREFTQDGSAGVTSQPRAAQMCAGCPITTECLLTALRHEQRIEPAGRVGVWGGTTPRQRWLIAKKGEGHPDAHRLRHLALGLEPADCARCVAAGQQVAA